MNAKGLTRLQRLLKRLQANNTAQERQSWVQPIITVLEKGTDPNIARYFTQQSMNLDTVWKFVIKEVENAIDHKQVLGLIQNIIRFIYLPDTLEIFFAENLSAQHALLTLHTSLQMKLRQELIAGLDELFLGCESAAEFLNKEENTGIYKVLSEIIHNVNKYEHQITVSKPITLAHKIQTQDSFTSLTAISLKQLTYLSALAKDETEGQWNDANKIEIIVNIPQPIISEKIISELFPEKEEYTLPEWMRVSFSLSSALINELKKHQELLYARYTNGGKPCSVRVEHKLAFLDETIFKAEKKQLTPLNFYAAWQNKPELFFATFKSKTAELWLKIKQELLEAFWLYVAKKTHPSFGYYITDSTLLKNLKGKIESFPPIPIGIDYKSMPISSRARWYQEKRSALEYLLEKHESGELCAEDFIYISSSFSCFNSRYLPWLHISETEKLITNLSEHIKFLLWADAGGEGPELQKQIRIQQQEATCLPINRSTLWSGKNI